MTHSFKLAAAGAALLGQSVASAALTDGLVAYYDMEDLANKALLVGSNTLVTQLNLTASGAAVGFAGNASFNSDALSATTDRSTLISGSAANFSTATGRLSTAYTSTQLLKELLQNERFFAQAQRRVDFRRVFWFGIGGRRASVGILTCFRE